MGGWASDQGTVVARLRHLKSQIINHNLGDFVGCLKKTAVAGQNDLSSRQKIFAAATASKPDQSHNQTLRPRAIGFRR